MEKFTIFVEKIDSKEQNALEILNDTWANKSPNDDEYEFYHNMRLEKFDREVLKEFIKSKITA